MRIMQKCSEWKNQPFQNIHYLTGPRGVHILHNGEVPLYGVGVNNLVSSPFFLRSHGRPGYNRVFGKP